MTKTKRSLALWLGLNLLCSGVSIPAYADWKSCKQGLMDRLTGDSPLKRENARATITRILSENEKPIAHDVNTSSLAAGETQLRNIFLNMPPSQFNEIWQIVRQRDLQRLHSDLEAGAVTLSPTQAARFEALYRFAKNDEHNVLWGNYASAWDALQTHYPHFRGPGHMDNVGGVIAGADTGTLTALERELFDAARNGNSRIGRGSFWQRQLRHPYFTLHTILSFHNQVRLRLEHVVALETAIRDELAQAGNLQFTVQERTTLDQMSSGVDKLRLAARADVGVAYGQDLFTGGFQQHPEADLYKIEARIKNKNLLQSTWVGEFRTGAEKIMLQLSEVLDSARARARMQPRELKEYDSNELRIWHFANYRHSTVDHEAWLAVMGRKTGEKIIITYEWQEWEKTGTRQVPDGNGGTKTEDVYDFVTKTATTQQELDYHDTLVNRLARYSVGSSYGRGTITSVSGAKAVLNASAQAAANERPFYISASLLARYQKLVKMHSQTLLLKDPKAIAGHQEELNSMMREIAEQKKALKTYSKKSKTEILAVWAQDGELAFADRHKTMLTFYDSMKDLLAVFSEQLARGEYELEIQADLLDHSSALTALAARAYMKIGAQCVSLTGLVATCTAYAMDPTGFQQGVIDNAQALMQMLTPILGP